MEAGQGSSSARGHAHIDTTTMRQLAGSSAARGHAHTDTTNMRQLAGSSTTRGHAHTDTTTMHQLAGSSTARGHAHTDTTTMRQLAGSYAARGQAHIDTTTMRQLAGSSAARGHAHTDTTTMRQLAGSSAARGHAHTDTTTMRQLAGSSAAPPMDATSQTGDAGFDWQEECYLKLQSMKGKYFTVLVECYQWTVIKLQQELMSAEVHGKLITFKLMLTRLLNLLAISKTAITHGIVSHLSFYEKRMVNIVSAHRAQKLALQAQGREEFLHLVANAHPTLQHPRQISQLQQPNNMQGSGMSLLMSVDGAVTVPCLNRSGKRLLIPESSSIVNHEGYPMSTIDSTTKKLKVGGTVVQEEPGSSRKQKAKEPTIDCPICLRTVVSPFSTFCGHVFCENCLKTAMQSKKECPVCRTKLTKNKIHKLFLSSAD